MASLRVLTSLVLYSLTWFTIPGSAFVVPRHFGAVSSLSYPSSTVFQVGVKQSANNIENVSMEKPKTEFAALAPGSVVQIQVGNVTLARKAWKKRRRSGSPLLVPCSVLDMDRKNMVRWNILYLLQKFGTPMGERQEIVGYQGDDIALSMPEITKFYTKHLGNSLTKHAKALGHDTARSLVRDLFNRQIQQEYGVRVWLSPKKVVDTDEVKDDEDRSMWLLAPLSRQRAHKMAAQAGVLQFSEEDHLRMTHTGILRVRNNTPSQSSVSVSPHTMVPLSAAIRVSQRDVDTGIIQDGAIHTAVVFSLDLQGDGGSPLMTLSLNPTRGQVRDRLKMKAAGRRHFSKDRRLDVVETQECERRLKDLKVGDGPFKAKVLRMSTRAGAAFVDFGVGRPVSQLKGGGTTRVLGMLRFDDLVKFTLGNDVVLEGRSTMSEEEAALIESALYDDEDYDDDEEDWDDEDDDDDDVMNVNDLFDDSDYDEEEDYDEEDDEEDDDDDMVISAEDEDFEDEEEEDITHLVSMDENGQLSYKDPDTGVTVVAADIDEDDDTDDEDDDEDENMFVGLSPQQRLDKIAEMMDDNPQELSTADTANVNLGDDNVQMKKRLSNSYQPSFVKVGDEVEVYVKSVFQQSGRFMVTIDPSVQGRKAKDLKKESDAEKKLARLVAKMGGEEGFQRIMELVGTECDGVIKATSKTGDWVYVQPDIESLPVGVAQLVGDAMLESSLVEGASVRVRLDGIDESRGQLAMTVIL